MDGLNGIQYVALRATDRGEAQHRKLRLQFADVVVAEGKVVGEIAGAFAMGFVNSEMTFQEGRSYVARVKGR